MEGEKRHEEDLQNVSEQAERKYNFELMEKIEPAMTSLVEQLKSGIEVGEYSALLGDDTKGRLPTLVLSKIFRKEGPPDLDGKPKTFFLAAGRQFAYMVGHDSVKKHLESMDFGNKKLLIVTDFIDSGDTLKGIAYELNRAGVHKFDFAALYAGDLADDYFKDAVQELNLESKSNNPAEAHNYFLGELKEEPYFLPQLRDLSGVKKTEDSLTAKKSLENTEDMKKSREDINLMAERIMKQVWEEKSND
jgi:hypoxanthine phosphoribosyltransferase